METDTSSEKENAWREFEATGNINSYLKYKGIKTDGNGDKGGYR